MNVRTFNFLLLSALSFGIILPEQAFSLDFCSEIVGNIGSFIKENPKTTAIVIVALTSAITFKDVILSKTKETVKFVKKNPKSSLALFLLTTGLAYGLWSYFGNHGSYPVRKFELPTPTNLHEACALADVEAVKTFLQQGQNPTEMDKNFQTPLYQLLIGIPLKRICNFCSNSDTDDVADRIKIYTLLQESIDQTKNLMNMECNVDGQTGKQVLVKEFLTFCDPFSYEYENCQNYKELLKTFTEKGIF